MTTKITSKQKQSLYLALGSAIVSFAIVIIGMQFGLFGDRIPGLQRFCEVERSGFIKQPANTFSNLAFIVYGLILAFQNFFGKFEKNDNLISNNTVFTNIFSLGLILTGAGSFAYHGNYAFWGSFFDLFGMFFLASFVLTYALMRFFNFKKLHFLMIFLVSLSVSSLVKIFIDKNVPVLGPLKISEIIFGLYLTIGIGIELYFSYFKKIGINRVFFALALVIATFSFIIWNLSYGPGSVLCNPNSLLQGHALWHILDATAGFIIFQYYVSEKKNFAMFGEEDDLSNLSV